MYFCENFLNYCYMYEILQRHFEYLHNHMHQLHKETIWDNPYIIELVGGIILAFIGFAMIWVLRPKVKIASKIAAYEKDGVKRYMIKIINRSPIFQLIDIHFELTSLEPKPAPNGTNLKINEVELTSDKLWFLSRRKWNQKEGYATFAYQVAIKDGEGFEKVLQNDDGTFLDFKVIAKNNFSGITSIMHKKFNHKTDIKKGYYKHGNTLEIEPET